MTRAILQLDRPWIPDAPTTVDELAIRRGEGNVLAFEDRITLEVFVLDPARYGSSDELLTAVTSEERPGRVVLVAGSLPVQWRAPLRTANVSFIETSGVVEIFWPRLRISARWFGPPARRSQATVPIRRGRTLAIQELLVVATKAPVSLADIATGAGVSLSTASRVAAGLADHGLVAKETRGRHVELLVTDAAALATMLGRTRWPSNEQVAGYLWGRSIWEVATRLSANATDAATIAITGRMGAAFLGVLSTSSPPVVWCWADTTRKSLSEMAELLGVEPSSADEANVVLSADR